MEPLIWKVLPLPGSGPLKINTILHNLLSEKTLLLERSYNLYAKLKNVEKLIFTFSIQYMIIFLFNRMLNRGKNQKHQKMLFKIEHLIGNKIKKILQYFKVCYIKYILSGLHFFPHLIDTNSANRFFFFFLSTLLNV